MIRLPLLRTVRLRRTAALAAKADLQWVCPSESGATVAAIPATPMSTLLAGHVLRDGELILLLLRPSRWFILLSSLRFMAIVVIFMLLALLFDDKLHGTPRQYVEIGIFLMAGRLMWAVLQWMGRLYILTDLRIIRLTGVFTVELFDCPLRKVARTLLEISFKERLVRVGSIAIIPQDEQCPIGSWQMVGQPRLVHEQISATISRAKQCGMP
jgi:hypothetical protein